MKTNKFRTFIILVIITQLKINAQNYIPGYSFGLNNWNSNYTGAPFGPGGISPLSSTAYLYAQATGAKIVRVGGSAYNNKRFGVLNYPYSTVAGADVLTPAGYVKIVDDVRAQGFEPALEMPFDDYTKTHDLSEQAAWAADVVRTVNITHKRNVKYWIIGNEPAIDQNYTNIMVHVQKVREYVQKYSVEMKKIDPNILIIAPELDYANTYYLSELYRAPSATPQATNASISGTIQSTFEDQSTAAANGKYFSDYLSFHTYPGFGGFTEPSVRQGYVDVPYSFASTTGTIYSNCINVTGNDRTGTLKAIVDEFNQSTGTPTVPNSNTTDYAQEIKTGNTFLAGQMIADLMGVMLGCTDNIGNSVFDFFCPWSVKEGKHFSMIDPNGDVRKPTYWHYWLMSKYFKGQFYKNQTADPGINNIGRCFRAYACKASNYIAVLVINQSQSVSNTTATAATYNSNPTKTLTINFNSGTADFKFNMSVPNSYTVNVDNKSTSLLFFDCSGNYTGQYDLKESDMTANPASFDLATHTLVAVPQTPTITVSGSGCIGNSVSLTAPANATWYASYNNFSVSIGSPSSVLSTTIPGLYHAKVAGTCTNYWLASVVSLTSPIISPTKNVMGSCSGTGTNLVVRDGAATYSWSPTTSPATGTNVVANPSSNTIYTVTGSSNGCATTETVNVLPVSSNSLTQDLMIQDDAADAGNEPNTTAGGLNWISPAIWISTLSPIGSPSTLGEYHTDGTANYIHVLINNKGNSSASGLLNVYWQKASMNTAWPGSWWNSTNNGTLTLGDQLGVPMSVTVAANGTTEIVIPWIVPNPNDYSSVVPLSDIHHYCLLARLETGCGMTYSETPSIAYNVLQNNNIASANIGIYDNNPSDSYPMGGFAGLLAMNTETVTKTHKIKIHAITNANSNTIFNYARPYMVLDDSLFTHWEAGGSISTNIRSVGGHSYEATANDALFDNISFNAGQRMSLATRFTFTAQPPAGTNFDVDFMEYQLDGATYTLLGGERYTITPPVCPTVAVLHSSVTVYPGCPGNLTVANPNNAISYTWYNSTSVVGTGSNVSVTPSSLTVYTVVAARHGCTQSATMQVNPNGTNPCVPSGRIANAQTSSEAQPTITGIRPNPALDQTTVSFTLDENQKYELMITNAIGEIEFKRKLESKETSAVLDCSRYQNGIYYVSLIAGSKVYKTFKLVVVK